MGQTIAEALKAEGQLTAHQESLRELLEAKFGPLPAELMQALAELRVAETERVEFERELAEGLARIEEVAKSQEVRWKGLVKFVLGWSMLCRPDEERESLLAAGAASQAAAAHQESVRAIGQTIAEALKAEGELRGELRSSREILRVLLVDKFGQLPDELVRRIAAVADVSQLQAAIRQVSRMNSLDELQL